MYLCKFISFAYEIPKIIGFDVNTSEKNIEYQV